MIEGVIIQELSTHIDERGFFRPVMRNHDRFYEEGFGQWSHTLMYHGVVKAWHVHRFQIDWWYVSSGVLKVALHDTRQGSPTFRKTMDLLAGDGFSPVCIKIPPGVAHGCKVLSSVASLVYLSSKPFNPSDEGRIPHDDPTIGYDWRAGAPIK